MCGAGQSITTAPVDYELVQVRLEGGSISAPQHHQQFCDYDAAAGGRTIPRLHNAIQRILAENDRATQHKRQEELSLDIESKIHKPLEPQSKMQLVEQPEYDNQGMLGSANTSISLITKTIQGIKQVAASTAATLRRCNRLEIMKKH